MKRGPYKAFLDPTSSSPIPRSTKHNLKKLKTSLSDNVLYHVSKEISFYIYK